MRRDKFPIIDKKIQEAVIQALEDVRSGIRERIEESVRETWFEGSTVRCGMYESIDIIDHKIAEVTKNEKILETF